MLRFVANRLVLLSGQVLAVVVVVFCILRILPANPAAQIVGTDPTPSALAHARHALGLDLSIGTQLERYFTHDLLHLSLGTSWSTQAHVTTELGDRAPVTLQLLVLAFALAIAVGVPLGRRAAANPGGRVDRATRIYSLFAGGQPDFWWGLLLVFLFSVKLNVFPVPTGLISATRVPPPAVTHFLLIDALLAGDWNVFTDALWHLVLPVVTLAFVLTGPLMKMTRESLVAGSESDYILYGRAAGLSQKKLRAMLLRNSVAPILTLGGILFGYMLGGAALIEYVFSLNGLGLYAVDRTLALDYPAVVGVVLLMTTISLLVYLWIDLMQSWLDPRVHILRR
jgi:ABC-type dipeptide/oligopeptide/nickel transport system permease component